MLAKIKFLPNGNKFICNAFWWKLKLYIYCRAQNSADNNWFLLLAVGWNIFCESVFMQQSYYIIFYFFYVWFGSFSTDRVYNSIEDFLSSLILQPSAFTKIQTNLNHNMVSSGSFFQIQVNHCFGCRSNAAIVNTFLQNSNKTQNKNGK